jgi:glycosyltransferase involved in cell wall biosynthesis
MKVLLLSDPNSAHTLKWARSLAANGVEIVIFGLGALTHDSYHGIPNIRVHTVGQSVSRNEGAFTKLKYLGALGEVRRVIAEFRPDVVHAHYATSYGVLGALCRFHPFVLSVWGGDVFSFPNRTVLHRWLLKHNLRKADRILSTSNVMAAETRKYTTKDIEVTPFGVDLSVFRPQAVNGPFAPGDIVVGTVKTLEAKYGIEYLVRAFHQVRSRHPALPLKLLIVGGGSLEQHLRSLVRELGIDDCTHFTGYVRYDEVPAYHNMLSISVSVSVADSESFGVAIIEAGACEKPVVVSKVGGLPEVVEDGVTGLVVPPRDTDATAAAIERLVLDPALRSMMGRAGRERVRRLYDWDDNVRQMIGIYQSVAGQELAAPGAAHTPV